MSAEFKDAFETSIRLAEKVAAARPASLDLREKQALADFATFGFFKAAAIDPAAISALQKALGWGVGLGLPAYAVGHALTNRVRREGEDLLREARNQAILTALGATAGVAVPALAAGHGLVYDARRQAQKTLRDARNQAILTAAGVGGVHTLGNVLKNAPAMLAGRSNMDVPPHEYQFTLPEPDPSPYSMSQKLSAAIMVDDVLEQACELPDEGAKYAALVQLIRHRGEATSLLRSLSV